MRYKIENLEDINDTKSFMNAYQFSCSFKLLKYIMYLIIMIMITITVWSRYAKKDIVINTFGVLDVKNHVCNIYIENTRIGNIKENKDARIEIVSLPKNEYGVITSKIDRISDDVVTDESSQRSFYVATCSLAKDVLTNRSGEQVVLKNGMEARVSIICNTTTYFNYILDKLRL